MTTIKAASLIYIAALWTGVAAAQTPAAPTPGFNPPGLPAGTLPPEIAAAIRSAPVIQTLIPISGEEKFNQQIIKADEISFSESSRMTLTNNNVPWIVVAAKRFKFAKPDVYTVIQRDQAFTTADGSEGPPGSNGPSNPGEVNRTGRPGYPGGPGGPAGQGETRNLPDIYIVVGEVLDPQGPVPPGLLNTVFLFRGLDGGDGGIGGKGGSGGRAGDGKEGATSAIDCKEGGGPGGVGGAAGPGGPGGDAGAGGDGADITFVTTRSAYEVLSYSRINNVGGRAGQPGHGGDPGSPGTGGKGAPANGWCKSTGPGAPGHYPMPINLGDGKTGVDGKKGTVTAVIMPTIDPLFP